jgi:hypothetical protein
MIESSNCQPAKPGSLRSIVPDGKIGTRPRRRKLFPAFILIAAFVVAVQARPLIASVTSASESVTVKAKTIPTKTVLSYSASTGTKAIFTAKVFPSTATGSVLFVQGPPGEEILLGVVFLVHGVAKLRHLPSGIPKGYQQFEADYMGSSHYQPSTSNTIHATIK